MSCIKMIRYMSNCNNTWTNKKGRLGKLKLTGKLIADIIRTGHTDLLNS